MDDHSLSSQTGLSAVFTSMEIADLFICEKTGREEGEAVKKHLSLQPWRCYRTNFSYVRIAFQLPECRCPFCKGQVTG